MYRYNVLEPGIQVHSTKWDILYFTQYVNTQILLDRKRF